MTPMCSDRPVCAQGECLAPPTNCSELARCKYICRAKAPAVAKDFQKYFDFKGDLRVSGTVLVEEGSRGELKLSYNLTGVDPECIKGPQLKLKNSCGLHIHEGSDCDGNTGPHFYDKDKLENDPWLPIAYKTTG